MGLPAKVHQIKAMYNHVCDYSTCVCQGYDTIFAANVKGYKMDKVMAKFLGVKGEIQVAIVYQIFHMFMVLWATAFSYVLWHSRSVHLGFCIFLGVVAAWNGSTYYTFLIMKSFKKALKDVQIEDGAKKGK